jgi:hypothetical protein
VLQVGVEVGNVVDSEQLEKVSLSILRLYNTSSFPSEVHRRMEVEVEVVTHSHLTMGETLFPCENGNS